MVSMCVVFFVGTFCILYSPLFLAGFDKGLAIRGCWIPAFLHAFMQSPCNRPGIMRYLTGISQMTWVVFWPLAQEYTGQPGNGSHTIPLQAPGFRGLRQWFGTRLSAHGLACRAGQAGFSGAGERGLVAASIRVRATARAAW